MVRMSRHLMERLKNIAYVLWHRTVVVAALGIALAGCGPLIADYSLDAYKSATSLKAETDALIDKAGENFSAHRKDVEALQVKIDAAYEFDNGRSLNSLSAAEWQMLRDPKYSLFGGFIQTWQAEGKLLPGYRSEKKNEIDLAFTYIICLEANKQRPTSCSDAAKNAAAVGAAAPAPSQ